MKLYDEVFIPDEEQGVFLITKERMEDSAPVHVTYASKEEAVIVLTLEELREVFDAGSNYVYLDVPHNQNFEQFLKSKGIQL